MNRYYATFAVASGDVLLVGSVPEGTVPRLRAEPMQRVALLAGPLPDFGSLRVAVERDDLKASFRAADDYGYPPTLGRADFVGRDA